MHQGNSNLSPAAKETGLAQADRKKIRTRRRRPRYVLESPPNPNPQADTTYVLEHEPPPGLLILQLRFMFR